MHMRELVISEERLIDTLIYLAIGRNYVNLKIN